jgi:hypothetical protein
MKSRFHLLLIERAASRLPAQPQRMAERGFFVAVVVLVLLGVVLGSLAIANRIGSGALRSTLQSQSREARDAADDGVLAVVNELNRFENRELLVTRTGDGWSSANTNPCASAIGVPATLKNQPPTATALGFRNNMGDEIQLAGDTTRRFVVRRIEVLLPDRRNSSWALRSPGSASIITQNNGTYNGRGSLNLTNANNVGYIRLTVEGRYFRGGTQVSSATVTREFQVVPKCCFSSFGPVYPNGPGGAAVSNAHGVDDRYYDQADKACPDALGLVAFGTGDVAPSVGSVAAKVGSSTGPDLTAVLCVSGSCNPGSFASAQVVNSRLNLPLVPAAPSGTYQAISSTATLPNTSFCTLDSGLTRFVQNPAEPNPGTETAWRCRVSSISLTGTQTLTIYTNATAANASGPTAASGASVPVRIWLTGDISLGDNSEIRHVKGSSTATLADVTPFDDADVATNPPDGDGILNFYDLHLYGNPLGGAAQAVDLRGTSAGLSLFLYAPTVAVSFSGGGGAPCNISGQIWANRFDASDTPTTCTPPSGSSGGFTNGSNPVIYDVVARSTWGARLYGLN